MSSSPEHAKLGDFIRIEHGWAFKGELFADVAAGRPIVVKPGNFRPSGGFDSSYGRTQSYTGDFPSQFLLTPGDLLVVMTCQTQGGEILGVPGWVPDDGRTYLHNQRIGRVVLTDRERADLGYVYWLLADPRMRSRLVASATGSTVLHTSPARIADLDVRLPSLDQQRRVAGVLGALDDKIEHNQHVGRRLSELLSIMFQQMLSSPWKLAPLADQVEVIMGQSPPGTTYSGDSSGVPLVQGMASFGDRYPRSEIFTSAPTKMTSRGDVLMTVRAPVGEINVADGEYCAGRGVAILRGRRPAYTEQLMRFLGPFWREHESGTIYPSVNRSQIMSMSAPKRS